jgi:DNA-directed RNA polymerase subunit RPC12/RpoP
MSITFECGNCRKTVKAPDEAGGKRGKCPYCGHSVFIPNPAALEEDIIPLAPLDEAEEQRRKKVTEELLEYEKMFLSGEDFSPPIPLEHRENLTSEDLHHLVVNYCLDMNNSNLERARMHVEKMKPFKQVALAAVDDFLGGKVHEAVLEPIGKNVLAGFLRQLRRDLQAT